MDNRVTVGAQRHEVCLRIHGHRETILADLPRLIREANDLGRINIQDGTKGGRSGASPPRWIVMDDHVRDALGFARQVSPAGSTT